METPNDFGRMGALPTHPELLDWLAVEFRDGGQSLKTLHKLVLKSYAFRQSSNIDNVDCPALADALAVDAGNKFLWRMNRRKLDAESIRDSVLAVSGKLDLAVGGPAFQDFVIEKPEHSPHYQYHLHDPNDAACHRRSIYRFIVRSQLQPFMNTLDCADPSLQVARRNESLTPLQALAMLNDGIIVTMSKHLPLSWIVPADRSATRSIADSMRPSAAGRPKGNCSGLLYMPNSMVWRTTVVFCST